MIDIAEARRLWAATTQGTWQSCGSGVVTEFAEGGKASVCEFFGGSWQDKDATNAEFVAWSHNNTPVMLDEIERLRQRCSDLWDVLHDSSATIDSAGSNELYARVNHELDKGALGLTGTAGKG